MAVGNVAFPVMAKISGVRLGTSGAGIKQTERDDILVLEMCAGATCAAVFTQNLFAAAPVCIARANLANSPRWLLVNSGNANAGTGEQGVHDAEQCCNALAALVGGEGTKILPFSTGVIGENLPVKKIKQALPAAVNTLQEDNWRRAAHAIMTTDTVAKGASLAIEVEGQRVTLSGIAKGAGMIQPTLATLLAFVATDANINQELLQHCWSNAMDNSFNRITVDGDTSTNDACVLIASGRSLAPEITANSRNYEIFSEALTQLCKRLAELIVRDGEGATKLIRICVEQAKDDAEAVLVAKTVAHSPLVKTAFFASDPNWGRILAAVGRCQINAMDLSRIDIYLDAVCIVSRGVRAATYSEAQGQQVMQQDEITVRISLARGTARQEILTCDLSYDYVRINAEYRT